MAPSLLEILPAPVAWIRADGILCRLNCAFEDWCGLPRSEYLDRPCADILPALIGATAAAAWIPCLRSALQGEPVQVDSRVLRSCGRSLVRVSFTPDRDDSGRVREIVLLLRDIAEPLGCDDLPLPGREPARVAADAGNPGFQDCDAVSRLLSAGAFGSPDEALHLHQQAIHALPVGVSIARYDPEGDFPLVYVNPAFEKMTGYRRDEVLGRNGRFLQGPATEPNGRARLHSAIEEGQSVRVTIQNYRKCGAPFVNDVQISPVHDSSGRITHLVGIQNDITDRSLADERLTFQARYDPVTGVPNRYLLMELLRQGLRPLRRRGNRELAVVYVDLDNFKQVNDLFGHAGGDRVLRQFAQRIRSAVRRADVVARIGGDEFVVLVSEFDSRASIERLIERILKKVSFPLRVAGRELVITASAGYAVAPGDAVNGDELLRKADLAMYSAKRECRNTWKAWSRSMESGHQPGLDIVSGLHRALKKKEFVLMYQPRIDAASGILLSLEALIRWQHPERGMIPPGDFIAVAEETGLIIEIGEWVLQESLRQLSVWRSQGYEIVPVSINVSAAQFRNPAFPDIVSRGLRSHNLSADLLEIELTESIFMDESVSKDLLPALRGIGVRVAIDDFGTGYSGLGYLSRFSVDTLKIDRSFTSAIGASSTHSSICRSILQLAQELSLTTVAEGVETAEQAGLLREWGCDQLQGFHFSRPVHAGAIADMLGSPALSPMA